MISVLSRHEGRVEWSGWRDERHTLLPNPFIKLLFVISRTYRTPNSTTPNLSTWRWN